MPNIEKKGGESLRFQLAAPFVIGTICLVCFLVAYTYQSAHKAYGNAVLTISEAKTVSKIDGISLLIKSLRSRAQDLVVDPGILNVLMEHDKVQGDGNTSGARKRFAQTTSRRLVTITEGFRYFRDILLLDGYGDCIASSNESYLGMNYSGQLYVQQALKGHFYLGKFSVGRVTKNFSAYFSAPIDIKGELDGVLVIISDFPGIVSYDSKGNPGPELSTSMLSPDGNYMAHKNHLLMANKDHCYQNVYDSLVKLGERGGAVEYVQDGHVYVGYAQVEPYTEWVVVTSGLKKQLFAPAYKMGWIVFVISSSFLCIMTFVVLRYASNILDSLFSLIRFAKHVSEGNWDSHLDPSTRSDELGVLHDALQNLVSTLQVMLQQRRDSSKMKDEFLANMSHEMRTPLNAVLGLTHLAQQKGVSDEKRDIYLKRIKVAAQSLLGVINDILDISKVEAGKMTIEANVFELQSMSEDTLAIHQQAAQDKALNLGFHCAPNVHEYYVGDVLRIRQILNNLLSNALKFTEKGEVILRCWAKSMDDTDHTCDKQRLYFSVSDTGVGIPADVLEHLFQPFTQADASVTRQFGGTGLGLAISKHLVSLMDGDIWVESVEGEGSTFTFFISLPVAQDQDQGLPETQAPKEDSQVNIEDIKGKQILLAEDNAVNQMIFQALLTSFAVELTIVRDGEQAVAAVKEKSFDLILMDLQMPNMGGLDATELIRKLDQGKDCPIIALTANARDEDKSKAYAAGMDDYLIKPVDPHHFTKVVRKWLLRTG